VTALRSFVLFLTLYGFWLLMSGYFTPFLMAAGAGSALVVVWLSSRFAVIDEEGMPLHLVKAVPLYWPWLIKEIVKCAWDVSKIIVNPKLPISPTLVRFKPGQTTPAGLVLHANSITLTPGTIAIEADGDEFLVHGLTSGAANGCIDSEMNQRVSRCEGGS
jgi:multicomponent Na+:H+ antiporter subunit E